MSAQEIEIRASDTEPLEITISATGLSNLDSLSTAVIYLRSVSGTAHVSGASLTVASSEDRTLAFDPVGAKDGGGNALEDAGLYRGYVLATWSDGDTTRHPGGRDLVITVRADYE